MRQRPKKQTKTNNKQKTNKKKRKTRKAVERTPKSYAQRVGAQPTSFRRTFFQETRMDTVPLPRPRRKWEVLYPVWQPARIWTPGNNPNGRCRRAGQRGGRKTESPPLSRDRRCADQPKPPAGVTDSLRATPRYGRHSSVRTHTQSLPHTPISSSHSPPPERCGGKQRPLRKMSYWLRGQARRPNHTVPRPTVADTDSEFAILTSWKAHSQRAPEDTQAEVTVTGSQQPIGRLLTAIAPASGQSTWVPSPSPCPGCALPLAARGAQS